MNIHRYITKPRIEKYSYLILFLLLGVLLMVLPKNSDQDLSIDIPSEEIIHYSIVNEEKRLEDILSQINGVGKCKVLLSVHTGAERVLAEDEGETVIVSEGNKQETVTVQTRYPTFQGAVIVCGGSTDTNTRYDILSSVMAYTGLTVDRITICPIKE